MSFFKHTFYRSKHTKEINESSAIRKIQKILLSVPIPGDRFQKLRNINRVASCPVVPTGVFDYCDLKHAHHAIALGFSLPCRRLSQICMLKVSGWIFRPCVGVSRARITHNPNSPLQHQIMPLYLCLGINSCNNGSTKSKVVTPSIWFCLMALTCVQNVVRTTIDHSVQNTLEVVQNVARGWNPTCANLYDFHLRPGNTFIVQTSRLQINHQKIGF